MKLAAKARMAVTGLADIAAFGRDLPVPLSAVAERQRLSLAFLEQIFGKLRRAGLVESRRGAQGGYVLTMAPERIALSAIVDAVDEEVRSTACKPMALQGCTGTSARCLTHQLWAELDDHIDDWLQTKTLADVRAEASSHDAPPASQEAPL